MRISQERMEPRTLEDLASLSLDISRLTEGGETSDLVIVTGEEETQHPCHVLILNLRCQKLMNVVSSSSQRREEGRTVVRLPATSTPAFTTFKHFVYSGRLVVDNINIFEVMRLGEEFGVPSLVSLGLHYVSSSLTLISVLDLLNQFVEVTRDELTENQAIKQILSFIKDNLAQLRDRKLIKSLSKLAITRLIKSRSLDLDENDVWRLALDWARLQTGLEDGQSPKLWNEDQRSRVRTVLDGVVQHIRILNIDSSVFAEEVEPTGAIPMELSLERYRHAALPDKYQPKPKPKAGDFNAGFAESRELPPTGGSRVECARALPAVIVKPENRPRHRIPEDMNRLNPRVETDPRPNPHLHRPTPNHRLFHGSTILAALGQDTNVGYYEKVTIAQF